MTLPARKEEEVSAPSSKNVAKAPNAVPAPLTIDRDAIFSEFEKSARVRTRAAYLVIIAFFGGFVGWASIAPLKGAVVANGTFIVEGNRKTVQHLEGGIIREILRHDGDHVQAGDVLIRLDTTATKANVDLLRGQYWANLALEARLIAERDKLKKVVFPQELLDQANRPEVKQMISAQINIFNAHNQSYEGQVAILKQQIAQNKEQIIGFQKQIESGEKQMRFIRDELEGKRELLAKGLIPKPQVLALERTGAQIEGGIGRYQAEIASSQQAIGEANMKILNLDNSGLNDSVEKLRDTQTQLDALREKLRAADDTLYRADIRAPISGVVVDSRVFTTGGVIGSGQALMDIVPQKEKLVIEAQVNPRDIDLVHTGSDAQVRLTALNTSYSPEVDGTVTYVSADRLVDPKGQNPDYYKVNVEVPTAEVERVGGKLYPGMPAEVLITTSDRTVMEYLLKPLTDRFARAMTEQ